MWCYSTVRKLRMMNNNIVNDLKYNLSIVFFTRNLQDLPVTLQEMHRQEETRSLQGTSLLWHTLHCRPEGGVLLGCVTYLHTAMIRIVVLHFLLFAFKKNEIICSVLLIYWIEFWPRWSMFYTTVSRWLTGVLGRFVFFPSSWFLHGIAIVQLITQRGAGQEIASHYSQCLWPNNKIFFKMCASNLQMHFNENQDFQLQF